MFAHMDYIYEVYKELSFSKAAKNLFISQSSLSLTIKRAEEKIGMPIFDRSTFPIQLTEFGKMYIAAVDDIKMITNNLNNYIYDMNNLKKGHLSIGAGNFFSTYLAAPVISLFKEKYPNISIDLLEGRTLDLEPQLAKGNINLLITNAQLDSSVYRKILLFKEHLILVIPKRFLSEPLYTQSLISFDELNTASESCKPGVPLDAFKSIPFVGLRPGNDSRIRTDKIFADYHMSPTWTLELDQSSTAFALACNGMGACIVGDTLIRQLGNRSDIYLYALHHPQTTRDVVIYTKSEGSPTRTMNEFIRIFRSFCNVGEELI